MINLESVKSKTKKRIGRGISAGGGKTAGRGTKGQKSRSGHNIPRRFEGGQTPLSMRLPKLPGFKSVHKKAIVITLDVLSKNFKAGEVVSRVTLSGKGLTKISDKVKILNTGTLSVKLVLADDVKVSKSIADLFTAEVKEVAPKKVAKPAAKKPAPKKKVVKE